MPNRKYDQWLGRKEELEERIRKAQAEADILQRVSAELALSLHLHDAAIAQPEGDQGETETAERAIELKRRSGDPE